MKKKKNKVIKIVGSILLGLSIALNVFLGFKCGAFKNVKSLSGSVNESWRKTDVYCYVVGTYNLDYCYTNEDGDYIHHVAIAIVNNGYEIKYDAYFNLFDDLETFFVLERPDGTRYTTYTETTHIPGSDVIFLPEAETTAQNLRNAKIVEVWVRTVD